MTANLFPTAEERRIRQVEREVERQAHLAVYAQIRALVRHYTNLSITAALRSTPNRRQLRDFTIVSDTWCSTIPNSNLRVWKLVTSIGQPRYLVAHEHPGGTWTFHQPRGETASPLPE